MSYNETLDYIHSVKWQGSKPGLSRTFELLKKLGNPEKKLKFVHIAGTNGKGSTAACIASVLTEAGYKTGLYTSPFLLRFNERIRIDGVDIPDAELSRVTDAIRPFADAMEDAPTEFEMITAIAMQYFADEGCDIVVLEVGLGGELDSTNVIDTPEVAVITSIGLDHTKELGDSITEIAAAKAGIIKSNGTVVSYGENAQAEAVFAAKCRENNAKLTNVDFSKLTVHSVTLDGCRFSFSGYEDLFIPLPGVYQPKNAALAITALEALCEKGYRITDEHIIDGIGNVTWQGRFEVLSKEPIFILDAAHNAHGMQATVDSFRQHFRDEKITFIMGVMRDKDIEDMLALIMPHANRFITVTPDNPRAMPAEELAQLIRSFGAEAAAADSIENAVRNASADKIICALGSLYMSGDVRRAVEKQLSTNDRK